MKIRIAGVVSESIVDGPGFRYVVFTQGCLHGCIGCHNPDAHDPLAGKDADTEDLTQQMGNNSLLDGLTLSGGEPFMQAAACAALAQAAHELRLNVWVFSGFTFEELLAMPDPDVRYLLDSCDVLVDGRFERSLRTLELRFRGSKNQRLIDLPTSLMEGKVVELT